jgi:hypothetical protein
LFEWLKAKEMLKPYNLVPSEISADEYEVSTVLENIRKSTFDEFEMAGETSIKSAIDEGGVFDKHRRILAREWLESKNEIRENRRDRREEEAVLIAKEAKLATIEQARWAKWAMVISFLALVASVISVIVPLHKRNQNERYRKFFVVYLRRLSNGAGMVACWRAGFHYNCRNSLGKSLFCDRTICILPFWKRSY